MRGVNINSFFFILSWVIVAFGQPAWSPVLSVVAACSGFALFFYSLIDKSPSKRFALGALWFFAVQLIQLSWLLAHPYLYIVLVYLGLAFLLSLQMGLLLLFITRTSLQRMSNLLFISSLWTLFEWSRLFFLAGFTWNPSGLSLSATLFGLQLASVGGVFFLSFLVMLTNLLLLRFLLSPKHHLAPLLLFVGVALFPYLFGWMTLHFRAQALEEHLQTERPLNALLVQTAFPVEEMLFFSGRNAFTAYVLEEWEAVFSLLKDQPKEAFDLILFPEVTVPFGTWTPAFPYKVLKSLLIDSFGEEVTKAFPPLKSPFVEQQGLLLAVNNAFIVQTLATLFHAPLVIGLEESAWSEQGKQQWFSSAVFVRPQGELEIEVPFPRYDKRVLLPMAEYIPFSFCRTLAASYGIGASFTHGQEAKCFSLPNHTLGCSICYEETFGHLMRENVDVGAQVLLNLTNDGWYPSSRLSKQHFDLSRLRSVELGLPLLRACNTGITAAIDSLGRLVGELEGEERGVLRAVLPTYTYSTLYGKWGDWLVVGFSLGMLCLSPFVAGGRAWRRLFRRK